MTLHVLLGAIHGDRFLTAGYFALGQPDRALFMGNEQLEPGTL